MLKKILVVLLCLALALAFILPTVFLFAEPVPGEDTPPPVERENPPEVEPEPDPEPVEVQYEEPVEEETVEEEPAVEKGDPNKLTILFTHDMHSHLEKFPALATIIKETKKADPDTLVLDAGDFSMGTPFQTIYKEEASELRMMGSIGFDATTLGNHEFDYRSAGLSQMLNTASEYREESAENLPKMVVSNIDWDKTLGEEALKKDAENLKKALDRYGAKEYEIIQKEGKKIALIGLFGKQSAAYAPESGTYFRDEVEAAKELVAKIKKEEKPDVIIALSHSGTDPDKSKSEDEILAEAVPDIDVIISGHSHTMLQDPIEVGNTLIVSCGAYDEMMGKLELTRKGKDEKFKLSKYELLDTDEVEPDEATAIQVDEFKGLVDSLFFNSYGYSWDQVITYNSVAFSPIENFGKVQREEGLGNMLADSFIYATKQAESENYKPIDVALVNSGSIRSSFSEGPVTVAAAYNVLSLGTGPDGKAGYPLVSIYLTGAELRSMAEVDATVSDAMNEARLYMSGLVYRINPHRLILNKISEIYLVKDDLSAVHKPLPYAVGLSKDSENPSRLWEDSDLKAVNEEVDKALKDGNLEKLDSNKLYRVVGDLYACQMLGAVTAQSKGILSIVPKDENGNKIDDFEKHIVHMADGRELKEWYAVTSYMNSFGEDGVPAIYGEVQGRKMVEDVTGLSTYFKNPGKVFWMALGVIVLIVAIIILILVLILRFFGVISGRKSRVYSSSGIFGPSSKSFHRRSRSSGTIFKHRKNRYKESWRK